MRTLIAAFHRSVRDGLPPPVPFQDGAAVVATLEAILACLRAGNTVAGGRRVPA
jgi:predicted dehydrogenase